MVYQPIHLKYALAAISGLAALMISTAAPQAQIRGPPAQAPENSEEIYDKSLNAILRSMKELTDKVLEYVSEGNPVTRGIEYNISSLSMLDKLYKDGMPLTSDGSIKARLVKLYYIDSNPAGLSKGDEISYELQMTVKGKTCKTAYGFSWDKDGRIGGSSSGKQCTDSKPPGLKEKKDGVNKDKVNIMDMFGTLESDKEIVIRLLAKETELRQQELDEKRE